MTEAFQQLIEQRLPLPGVAAWAVRLPDQSVAYEAFLDWFSVDQLTQILTHAIQAAESLPRHHLEPQQLSWVFDHARVHLAVRTDGAYLAVFVENRPEVPTADIYELLSGFRALAAV